jgi:hypothetical protein
VSRLGGGLKVNERVKGLFVHTHKSVEEALGLALKGTDDLLASKRGSKSYEPHKEIAEAIHALAPSVLRGNAKLALQVERADALIDDILIADPRLNRRHGWVRSEEGIELDPILLAAGEPACCIDRKRIRMADANTTTEPVRIVISTDSAEDAHEKHVVAFIAAARLAQQFRPLEIWWQGAWLSTQDYNCGTVLLAPLIQGDMDFGRVQFFLSHELRDRWSYRCMWYHSATVPSGGKFRGNRVTQSFGAKRAEYSHLENTFDFVTEKGIPDDPSRLAALAAKWAGLPSIWEDTVDGSAADQWWRPKDTSPFSYTEETPAQKAERDARWARDQKEREAKEKAEAAERLGNAQ